MLKKILIVMVLLAGVAFGLQKYAEHAPHTRVAFAIKRIRESVPRVLAGEHVRWSDVVETGQDVVAQSKRDVDKQSGKTIIYKWRDAGGNWTYGNSPPPGVQAMPQQLDTSKTYRLTQ